MNPPIASRAPGWYHLALSLGLALTLLPACASSPKRESARAATLPNSPASATEEQPVPPSSVPPPSSMPLAPTEPITIVIDEGEEAPAEGLTLAEASRLARERKQNAPPPTAVITNKNLSQWAKRGDLTVADPKASGAKATPTAEPPTGSAPTANGNAKAAPKDPRGEEYWRSQALRLRQRWRDAYDQIQDLEKQADALRFRFYDEEDIVRRDSEIKPAWDRTLDLLERAREQVAQSQDELEDLIEDGRRAGALPGWLREGVELEPEEREPKPEDDLDSVEPVEPEALDGPP
jgi:hypothetical protein